MRIPFAEPTAPRYIYVNPTSNQVHLMMPICSGTEIGPESDVVPLKELRAFFSKIEDYEQVTVLNELIDYKAALEFDINVLLPAAESKSSAKEQKQSRLEQISEYIKLIEKLQSNAVLNALRLYNPEYPAPLQTLMKDKDSNLYSMVLTGREEGDFPNSENPVFSVNRDQRIHGKLKHHSSVLDQTLHDVFRGISSTPLQFDSLLKLPPFFYHTRNPEQDRSILIQFFLATVNIYCHAKQLSSANFGQVLEASPQLSAEFAEEALFALSKQANIDDALLDFVNVHQDDLKLSQALTTEDMTIIKKQFAKHHDKIKYSRGFSEFMVFDSNKPGPFINHQGCICTDFCAFLAANPNDEQSLFVQQNLRDFTVMKKPIENKNEWIADSIELSITDEQLMTLLKKSPPKIQQEIRQSNPERMARIAQLELSEKTLAKFLLCVAKGQQEEAEHLLREYPDAQYLFSTPGTFTDYSGRTFHCSAYEYAYWAKDAHMCRMLESYMMNNDAIKTKISALIKEIERSGLAYEQNGEKHQSPHFDLTPLIMALQEYVDGYDNWIRTKNWAEMKRAWIKVGQAQRDVPAHVAHEYCREDRSFAPLPSFNIEELLPRTLDFYNYETNRIENWYPLSTTGLGVDYGLIRGKSLRMNQLGLAGLRLYSPNHGPIDLAAVKHLDEVRDANLSRSREFLGVADPEPDHGLRI